MIHFVIDGECVAQGRPRFSRNGHAYDPAKSRDYKAYVALAASRYKPKELLTGPLKVSILVGRSIPGSWSKSKKAAALNGDLLPTTKPDVDNLAKGIKDALSGIIWNDDRQVVDLRVVKKYASAPFVEVWVEEIERLEV